eukprot:scaffold1904_cov280-Chaetoceros_neogracile.AAC.32
MLLIVHSLRVISSFQAFQPRSTTVSASVRYFSYQYKPRHCHVNRQLAKLRMSNTSSSQKTSKTSLIPRAAVSVVVRHASPNKCVKYALVQRGNEPNKGIWSLPGGKIEAGELSITAAKRELSEETCLSSEHTKGWKLNWCDDAPICTTDSIHFEENESSNKKEDNVERKILFHYVISQWFVEILNADSSSIDYRRPTLLASDDAADAKWFNIDDVTAGIKKGEITPGLEKVLLRTELMYEKGLL